MSRRSYLCLYVYDNSKEFKIGIAGFSIYGTKSEKLRFYLGSSSRNFFSPPKLKMPPGALLDIAIYHFMFHFLVFEICICLICHYTQFDTYTVFYRS